MFHTGTINCHGLPRGWPGNEVVAIRTKQRRQFEDNAYHSTKGKQQIVRDVTIQAEHLARTTVYICKHAGSGTLCSARLCLLLLMLMLVLTCALLFANGMEEATTCVFFGNVSWVAGAGYGATVSDDEVASTARGSNDRIHRRFNAVASGRTEA